MVIAGSKRESRYVQLHYKLEAETFQESRKFSRIWFGPDNMSKSQIIEDNVSVDHNNKIACQKHTAYLKVIVIFTNLKYHLCLLWIMFAYRKILLIFSLQ